MNILVYASEEKKRYFANKFLSWKLAGFLIIELFFMVAYFFSSETVQLKLIEYMFYAFGGFGLLNVGQKVKDDIFDKRKKDEHTQSV